MNEKNISRIRHERRDAAENRQRILNSAIKLFEQNGVEQVSMNQIAIEAQIGPGTLYRRYRNKSELCLDLIKDNIEFLFADIDRYLKENWKNTPDQRLRGILHIFVNFREKKAQLLAGVEEPTPTNSLKTRVRSPLYNEMYQLFVALFDEMSVAEHNPPSSVFRADMLLIALSRDFYSLQRNVRGYSPEKFMEQLYLIFIN